MFSLKENKPIPLKTEGYPYSYARIAVMKSRLIPLQEYHKLIKMELPSIFRYIEAYGYKKAVESVGAEKIASGDIEDALNIHMVEIADKLRKITPDEVNILIDTFMGRWDIHNIKVILRAKLAGEQKESVKPLFVPAAQLKMQFLEGLMEKQSVEDVLFGLPWKSLKLSKELSKAIEHFKRTQQLSAIENCLDVFYYSSCLRVASLIGKEGELFKAFIVNEINMLNVRNLLRMKKLGLSKEEILDNMIPAEQSTNAGILDIKKLKKAVSFDYPRLLELLKKTSFKDALEKAGADSLSDIELELEKALIKKSFLFAKQFPLSVMAILSFMLAKITEINNLKAIIKGKQLGIEDDYIESKLIVAN